MEVETVNPEALYDPTDHGYSHVALVKGLQRTAFIAGQSGHSKSGVLAPDFPDQVGQAFANLGHAITAVSGRPENVLKLTTYIVGYDEAKLAEMNVHLAAMFKNRPPAQTLVPVPRLALDGMLFEVDAIVAID